MMAMKSMISPLRELSFIPLMVVMHVYGAGPKGVLGFMRTTLMVDI